MRSSLIVLTFLSLAACDDDGGGGGGGGPLESGVEGDKGLSSLSDAEVNTLCESFASYGQALLGSISKEDICIFVAAALMQDSTSCEAVVPQCVADPEVSDPSDEESPACTEGAKADFMNCTATVDELEGCMEAYMNKLRSDVGGATCASAGQGASLDLSPNALPACASVVEKCPGLFNDDDDEI